MDENQLASQLAPQIINEVNQLQATGYSEVLTMIIRLLIAALAGAIVAWFAKRRCDHTTDPTLTFTLLLMCMLIAMATQIIGSNMARAFSLVGALSIVRFRTAVSSTQDVAFVLAAVVVGMAIGAGQLLVGFAGLTIFAVVSCLPIEKFLNNKTQALGNRFWKLQIESTLGSELQWRSTLESLTSFQELIGTQTIRRGSAVEFEYRVQLRPEIDSIELSQKLGAVPQVESVSIKIVEVD
jgi:uncharacterized membrane protein YhiD involved in acid resistance